MLTFELLRLHFLSWLLDLRDLISEFGNLMFSSLADSVLDVFQDSVAVVKDITEVDVMALLRFSQRQTHLHLLFRVENVLKLIRCCL